MFVPLETKFVLPKRHLSSLPTGAVKTTVDSLGRKIAAGEYAVGETIPMEHDLAVANGVSRTVVREAIKVLSGKGMVRTARRYGTRVCAFEDWHLMDPDVIVWHQPDSAMAGRIYKESTELRSIFEPRAASLAAQNATIEQKRTIATAAAMTRTDLYGFEGFIAADFAFHSTILEASQNLMLSQLQGLVLALLEFTYPRNGQPVLGERAKRAHNVRIAGAIMRGEAMEAEACMAQMLLEALDLVKNGEARRA